MSRPTFDAAFEYFMRDQAALPPAVVTPNFWQGGETAEDAAVLARLFGSKHGDEIRARYDGTSPVGTYASQSEADLALMNDIAFFSKDRAQTERMFRATPSYRPATYAHRQDLIDRMLDRAFDGKVFGSTDPNAFAAIKAQLAEVVEQSQIAPRDHALPTDGEILPIIWAAGLANEAPLPPEWLVAAWIIARNVTLLYGDGGTGKSLLALMLAYAVAANVRWLGKLARSGPALFLTAEDELAEVHRRLYAIARLLGVPLDQTPYPLAIASLADGDALLAAIDPATRALKVTALYEAVRGHIEQHRPAVVILDTLADLFGGNENDRGQARWFIGQLRRLAITYDTTIVLLAHPSRDGISSGRGDGGSTAWHNSVRNRLSMTRPQEGDPNKRILETKKSNYGAIGETIELEYRAGTFAVIGSHTNDAAHRAATEQSVDDVFLSLLAEFTERGQTLSRSPQSIDYAPKLFAKDRVPRGGVASAARPQRSPAKPG